MNALERIECCSFVFNELIGFMRSPMGLDSASLLVRLAIWMSHDAVNVLMMSCCILINLNAFGLGWVGLGLIGLD